MSVDESNLGLNLNQHGYLFILFKTLPYSGCTATAPLEIAILQVVSQRSSGPKAANGTAPPAGIQPAGHSNAHLLGPAPYDNESGDSQPLAYMEPQPSPCFASTAAAALDHDDPDAILPTAITTPPASTKVDPPGTRYIDNFPSQSFAGRAYGTGRTAFDETADKETSQSGHLWESFANEDDWKLAQWLVKNVGHNQAEEFLKLNTVRRKQQRCWTKLTDLLDQDKRDAVV